MEPEEVRRIYILSLRGKPMLSIRQRMILARIAPLPRPCPAKRIASLLGGLIDRKTISSNLQQMAEMGLARKESSGWVAVEPAGEIASHFVRDEKKQETKWYRNYANWTMPLPSAKPSAGARNSAELYAGYFLIQHLERAEERKSNPGRVLVVSRIASLLGVSRLTARRTIMQLRDLKLLDGEKTAPHSFALQTKEDTQNAARSRKSTEVDGDVLDWRISRLSHRKELTAVIDRLTAGGWATRTALCAVVEKSLREHRKNGYPGDGSALLLNWLRQKLSNGEASVGGAEELIAEKAMELCKVAERVQIAAIESEREREEKKMEIRELRERLASRVFADENFSPLELKYSPFGEETLLKVWERVKDIPAQMSKRQLLEICELQQFGTLSSKPVPVESAPVKVAQVRIAPPIAPVEKSNFQFDDEDDFDLAKELENWKEDDVSEDEFESEIAVLEMAPMR